MASNAELIEQAKGLDANAETDGLNNAQLVQLVKDLRVKANRAELVEQAKSLDPEAPVDDMNDEQLAELVKDLKAKAGDENAAALAAAADKAAKARAQATAPKAKKKPEFYVAPRTSITTKRGILSGDTEDEITEKDLSGGKAALLAFVESGHILKG